MMREKISACVIAGNEERNMDRCLQSLTWCDEIVVVDSFSTDQTVEICRKYTDRVYQHKWLGYIGQKNLIRGMAKYPWILFLDADEEVSPALKDEIQAIFEKGPSRILGYQFPRKVLYLGKWICHGEWYPDTKLRLFKKEHGRSQGREPHDQVVVDGPIRTLKNCIFHYTYDDISEHLATMNRFTSITAREKHREGYRYKWSDWLLRPGWRFFKAYILKRGFLDGRRGLLIAWISTFAVAIKYAKVWELDVENKSNPPKSES